MSDPRPPYLISGLNLVKGRIGEIDVSGVHPILAQTQAFAEVINLSNGRSALEPQGIYGCFNEWEKCLDPPRLEDPDMVGALST